jgi:hypothetical protein
MMKLPESAMMWVLIVRMTGEEFSHCHSSHFEESQSKQFCMNKRTTGGTNGSSAPLFLRYETKWLTEELKAIIISEFQHCYDEWKNRLQGCIASQGK